MSEHNGHDAEHYGVSSLVRTVKGKITIPVISRSGATVGSVEIDPADFAPFLDREHPEMGVKISRQLLHDVVLMYRANQRAGTHHTLRRGQVAGSTKKLFKQKGTGNARVGSKRTNKRVGGGTAKGPKPRDYEYHLPKKAVKAATRMAILSKFADGECVILDELAFSGPKTKEMAGFLKSIKVGSKVVKKSNPDGTELNVEQDTTLLDVSVLIGTEALDQNIYKSGRNIEGVKVLPATEFNAYIVLKQKRLVLTKAALAVLQAKK